MQINSISISGQYRIDGKRLTPVQTGSHSALKCLVISPSKYAGRMDYVSAVITGNNKPVFISSKYEPRTKDGWFNIELSGVRYEVKKTDPETVEIYQYVGRRREVTFE
jgi:hypothetical protein